MRELNRDEGIPHWNYETAHGGRGYAGNWALIARDNSSYLVLSSGLPSEPNLALAVPLPAADPLAAVKSLVLDAVSSPHTKRSYDLALSRFLAWYVDTGSPGLTKGTVQRYRSELEARGLSASSLNVHLSAVRKLAAEAADNALLAPELAAGIAKVRGAKRLGTRAGNWLTPEEATALLNAPDRSTLIGCRDRALLALLARLRSAPGRAGLARHRPPPAPGLALGDPGPRREKATGCAPSPCLPG